MPCHNLVVSCPLCIIVPFSSGRGTLFRKLAITVLTHNTLSQKIRIRPPAHGSPIRLRFGLHFGCRWAYRWGRNGRRRAYSILCRSACWLPWRRVTGARIFVLFCGEECSIVRLAQYPASNAQSFALFSSSIKMFFPENGVKSNVTTAQSPLVNASSIVTTFCTEPLTRNTNSQSKFG